MSEDMGVSASPTGPAPYGLSPASGSQAEPLVPNAAALAFFAVLDEAICEAGRVFNSSSDDGGRRFAVGQCAGLTAAHILMQDLSGLRCELDRDGVPTGGYTAAER